MQVVRESLDRESEWIKASCKSETDAKMPKIALFGEKKAKLTQKPPILRFFHRSKRPALNMGGALTASRLQQPAGNALGPRLRGSGRSGGVWDNSKPPAGGRRNAGLAQQDRKRGSPQGLGGATPVKILRYGVMAALEILVLPVQVRIPVSQR